MIEIRSLKPFCPVIAVARPDNVGSVIAAYGYTRDEVVLTTKREHDDAESLREELERSKQEKASLHGETAQRNRAEAARLKAEQERDNAILTIRTLCSVFGREESEAEKIVEAARPTIKQPTTEAA